MKTIKKVLEFHEVFRRPINVRPTLNNIDINLLRVRLLREEVTELEEGLAEQDPEKVLDALTDIQYILDGSYISLGFYHLKDAAFELVHNANMKKLFPDGEPKERPDGKIIKPEGWIPPSFKLLLAMS